MPSARVVALGLALCSPLTALSADEACAPARAPAPSRAVSSLASNLRHLDASWFEDADELRDREPVARPPRGPLPERKRAFCARTPRDILDRVNGVGMGILQGVVHPLDGQGPTINIPETLAFDNPSGTFDTGLCWMHSRFQRSASYLANFVGGERLPRDKILPLIRSLAYRRDRVVEIPGFTNLHEFSNEYRAEITEVLDEQGLECVLDGDCLARLGDANPGDAGALSSRMDELYRKMFRRPGVYFMREKRAGNSIVFSHSRLIVGMEPIRKGFSVVGYALRYIDSNDPNRIHQDRYLYGQTATESGRNLYPMYDADLDGFEDGIREYCAR